MLKMTDGRWWDRGLMLVDGCTPCSPGCDHCWSAAMSHRFDGEFTGITPRFNGIVRTRPEHLSIPLKRRKPTVFAIWNDLFHEKVPEEFISDVLIKIEDECERHTFLILTKRPVRMTEQMRGYHEIENIYWGLTVCNQQEADEKIPTFLWVPGKKFLSIEPMLSEISLRWIIPSREWYLEKLKTGRVDEYDGLRELSGVIIGGETGSGARPIHPDWVRSIRDQCEASGVPFFLKYINKKDGRILDGKTHNDLPWRKYANREHAG